MRNILIIGGTGSWGQELTKQILDNKNIEQIKIYSRGEHRQVEMKRKFNDSRLKFIIGDIRDYTKLKDISKDVDHIFHLAALKHVPVCESHPQEAVKTNINGTINAVNAAKENKIDNFVLISTDKAVDPINVYGVSKSMAEKIVINANINSLHTKFVCVRGGNVLGTNGSVVPLFKQQIMKANEVTITDKNMTRFLMRLKDAISLIFKAVIDSKGGEIFVMKMPSIKIIKLANVMINELGNKSTTIKTIGIRPGEKIDEVLVSRYEAKRAFEYGDYYIVLPNTNIHRVYDYWGKKKYIDKEYNSRNNQMLDENEIKKLLKSEKWLNKRKITDLQQYSKEELLEYFKREKWTI